jgi:hypothetical protein
MDETISKWMINPPPTHGPPCSILGDREEVGSLELPTLLLVIVTPHCCCRFLQLPKKERRRMKERKEKIYKQKQNKKMMALWIKKQGLLSKLFFVFFSHLVFAPRGSIDNPSFFSFHISNIQAPLGFNSPWNNTFHA